MFISFIIFFVKIGSKLEQNNVKIGSKFRTKQCQMTNLFNFNKNSRVLM